MINNLNEINRILLAVRELTKQAGKVRRSLLRDYLREEVVLGKNPEFGPIIAFLKQLNLVAETKKGYGLTGLGEEILDQNSSEFFELQVNQCALLVRKCYLDGALRGEMKTFIKKLNPEPRTGEIVWSSIDSEPLDESEWLAEHLQQLGVLTPKKHLLVVTAQYHETISQFLDEGGDFTDEQFEAHLREKRLLSKIAEAYVVDFERKRLRASNHTLESGCVQRISGIRVNAGYDVNSFDGASHNLKYDRFIEVKGSGMAAVRFFWTPNEMEKARQLGENYWIYFVGGINRGKRLVAHEPVMIQNPHSYLERDKRLTTQPSGNLVVFGNISGKRLDPPVVVRHSK